MRAVVVEKPETVSIQDLPVPEPGPGEVVMQVAACGICGTDKHIYQGSFLSHYPLTPGHEFSGTVSAVGTGVHEVREGDRVAVDPSLFCGECYFCRKLQGNHCVRWGAIGDTTNGAFAEYVKVPARNCYPIPASLSFEEAAVIEPLSCVVYGQKRLQAQPGDSVLLLGAGPMGLLWTQVLRHGNASRIVVTDLHPKRLDLARRLGATDTVQAGEGQAERLRELSPHGFDIVIDVTGVPAVLQEGLDHAAPMGKVMVFGVCPPKSTITVEPFQVYNKDLTIVGCMALNYTFLPAIALLESGVVDAKPMLTHRLPLERFTEALTIAGGRDSAKVQIAPSLSADDVGTQGEAIPSDETWRGGQYHAEARAREERRREQDRRLRESDRLYERYAQHLEAEHWGELVIVSPDGRTMLGTDERELLRKAKEEFGPGNYLFRVGPRIVGRWL